MPRQSSGVQSRNRRGPFYGWARINLYRAVNAGDLWYIGAFSPAPGVLPYESHEPMIHKGLFAPREMTLPDEFKQSTFILMNNGYEEEKFNDIATSYHNAFNENRVPHIYYTTDGGHDFRVWKNGLYHFAKNIFKS